IDMPLPYIQKALEGVSLVILDCSLSPFQLNVFARLAAERNIPLMILGTSDSKAPNILAAELPKRAIHILIVNKAEFRAACRATSKLAEEAACFGDLKQLSGDKVKIICQALSTKNLIITLSEEGMVVLEEDGRLFKYDAPSKGKPVISTTGAGDALSAVVA